MRQHEVEGNGNTAKGATTTFNYDRNRLLTSTASGVTSAYNYDPFGRLDTVTATGQLIERTRTTDSTTSPNTSSTTVPALPGTSARSCS